MWYNLGRVQTLRVTPAMEAGVTDHVWMIVEVVALLRSRRLDAGEEYSASSSVAVG